MKPSFDMEVQPNDHFIIRCGDKKYTVLVTSKGGLSIMRKRKTYIDCGEAISPASLYRCLACHMVWLRLPKKEKDTK